MEIYGADVNGIDGCLIHFKATIEEERKGAILLGLAQKVVREGYLRAAKAIETLEGDWGRILETHGYTIQMIPSDVPRNSSGLDLPIAIMLLQASIFANLDKLNDRVQRLEESLGKADRKGRREDVKARLLAGLETLNEHRRISLKYREKMASNTSKYLLIGTLDIATGDLSAPTHGMFGMISAAEKGITVIMPQESEVHGALIAKGKEGIAVFKAKNLQEVWNVILGVAPPRRVHYDVRRIRRKRLTRYVPDLRAIRGVARAKRAMIVAIAGGHHILLVGPPGQGKGMLANAATNLLPQPSRSEIYEINKVYSAKGLLKGNEVILDRPFQQVSSGTGGPALFGGSLIGGGGGMLVPGIVSLAHRGILFFDEINQFDGRLIEQLKLEVLEQRVYRIQRVRGTVEYPCSFIMVAAMNPCKDGWYDHFVCPVDGATFVGADSRCPRHPGARLREKCQCNQREIAAYRDKLSRPLLDRIDLKVLVSEYDRGPDEEYRYASSTVRTQIQEAMAIQARRYAKTRFGWDCNAHVRDRSQFDEYCPGLPNEVKNLLRQVYRRLDLNPRTEDRLLLVSRTIADLAGVRDIRCEDVNEAIDLMGLDHPYFRHFGV